MLVSPMAGDTLCSTSSIWLMLVSWFSRNLPLEQQAVGFGILVFWPLCWRPFAKLWAQISEDQQHRLQPRFHDTSSWGHTCDGMVPPLAASRFSRSRDCDFPCCANVCGPEQPDIRQSYLAINHPQATAQLDPVLLTFRSQLQLAIGVRMLRLTSESWSLVAQGYPSCYSRGLSMINQGYNHA